MNDGCLRNSFQQINGYPAVKKVSFYGIQLVCRFLADSIGGEGAATADGSVLANTQ
jgi:hypothetical protein